MVAKSSPAAIAIQRGGTFQGWAHPFHSQSHQQNSTSITILSHIS
jgi:hypothetical protein